MAAKKKTSSKSTDAKDEAATGGKNKVAAKKPTAKKPTAKKTTRRKAAEAGSRGLDPAELLGEAPAEVEALAELVVSDGGSVLARYRDPLGGHWQLLVGLPLAKIGPSPFQRDLSATHAKRMTEVIDKLDRFLDPVIAVRTPDGEYWTPNGLHRLTALQKLGSKTIVALLVPDFAVVYKILALNTEKAHNLKEKSLEVIRMARSLAAIGPSPTDPPTRETDFALEFEEPALLTIGLCYEQRPRFSGGAYNPILRRCEQFAEDPLAASIAVREVRAAKVLELDDQVTEAVAALKARGFDSPYLKNFVVGRINPLKGAARGEAPAIDEVLATMLDGIASFDAAAVQEDEIGSGGGGYSSGEDE
jgi:ParB family transcriptional regulator, chromosome partitioning protein